MIGFNSRLDPIQASILSVKLRHLNEWNERRKKMAEWYREHLKETGLTLPAVAPWADHVWHLYVVRSKERGKLQKKLSELGIGTMIHYPVPPHLQGAYSNEGCGYGDLSIANKLANEVLSLPIVLDERSKKIKERLARAQSTIL